MDRKPADHEIPEGESLTGTVTIRNRVAGDHVAFVVTLDLPTGRIEACSGISLAGALKNFGTACAFRLPGMVRALPTGTVEVRGLRSCGADDLEFKPVSSKQ